MQPNAPENDMRLSMRGTNPLYVALMIATTGILILGPRAAAQRSGVEKPRRLPLIAFISSRQEPSVTSPEWLRPAEIYLMDVEGDNVLLFT